LPTEQEPNVNCSSTMHVYKKFCMCVRWEWWESGLPVLWWPEMAQKQFNYFINCKVDVGADDVYNVTVAISSLC